MDIIIQKQIDELVAELQRTGGSLNDPVAKLMVTALLHQARKIRDEISEIPRRVTERLCSVFVPKNKIDATPAVCLVRPSVRLKRDAAPHTVADGTFFTYKLNQRQNLTYYPLFRSTVIPFSTTSMLTPAGLSSDSGFISIQSGRKGQVWLGIHTPSEIESFENVSFLIKGVGGMMPRRVAVGNGDFDLTFVKASDVDALPLAEPFDSQQMSPGFVETFSLWRRSLDGGDGDRLIFITDPRRDRDAFRCRAFPKVFGQYLESSDLDRFDNDILWVLFDFGSGAEIPEAIEILPNVIPVANVSVNSVTLTPSSPIARLNKNDGSFFLSVMETPLSQQKQGFSPAGEEFVIRDFDTSAYNPATLYKDVRNLYNRFIDDYHAFVDYHGLKDGESVRSLREMVNRIGKSVQTDPAVRNRYDEGTYAMRSVGMSSAMSTVKVAYLTTAGRLGNTPSAGSLMENRKDAALDKDVAVVASADCGEDKAGADTMYEMLRYYTLTADRLYTRMDVDAFLRMRLLSEFGREEVKRISHTIEIHGSGGADRLRRGLYIGISFRDEKNYRKAVAMSLDEKLRNMIEDKSCISMPVVVTLDLTE